MYGASGLPMIDVDSSFSMTMTNTWPNAGMGGALGNALGPALGPLLGLALGLMLGGAVGDGVGLGLWVARAAGWLVLLPPARLLDSPAARIASDATIARTT